MAPGFRAVYDAADDNRHCDYVLSHCGIVSMYSPLFDEDNVCEIHYAEYLAGREEIRILRDLLLMNIAMYSIYSKPFLDVTQAHESKIGYRFRLLSLLVFVSFAFSVVFVYIFPFKFPSNKLIFDILELCIFVVGIGYLIGNLCWHKYHPLMSGKPRIIPHL